MIELFQGKIQYCGKVLTSNQMHPKGKHGKRYLTSECKQYKKEIGWLLKQAGLVNVSPPILIKIFVWFKRRGRDTDNIIKPIKDAMKGIAIKDDNCNYIIGEQTKYMGKAKQDMFALEIWRIEE